MRRPTTSPTAALALLLALLALLGAAPTTAAAPAPVASSAAVPDPNAPPPDWFEVELVVFRHTQPGAGATETWPVDPGRPAVEAARALGGFADPPVAFMALPPSASRLGAQWDKLVRSSRYQPIAYFAWLQPPLERAAAVALRIGSPAPAEPSVAPVAATTAPAFAFAPLAQEAPALPPLRTPLDGTATVGLARYLYLTLDLVYQPGDLAPLPDGTPVPPFRLTETRRMRSKDLHYFDHPLFGVIALITPRPAPPPAP